MLAALWEDQTGLTNVEYALLLALIAIAATTVWTNLGHRTSTVVAGATAGPGGHAAVVGAAAARP